MQPKSAAGKERHVGNIAHTVVRISEHRLIRRLWPTSARSADYAGLRGRSSRAAAGSAGASNRIQEIRFSHAAIAEPARSVSLAKTFELREQQTGAGVVPGNLGDIGLGRFIRLRIGGAPVSAVGPGKSIAEIGTAYGHVIRTRSPTSDSDTINGVLVVYVAARRRMIARGNEDRDTFGDRLLEGGVESCIG